VTNTALVVGAGGVVGSNLAHRARGWKVLGLARRPPPADIEGVRAVAADLRDPAWLRSGLVGLRPTHVFLATWPRQLTEEENVRVNAVMVRNVLHALSGALSVSHVALVTGLQALYRAVRVLRHRQAAGDAIPRAFFSSAACGSRAFPRRSAAAQTCRQINPQGTVNKASSRFHG